MARGRLRVHLVPPGGPGLDAGLAATLREDSLLTSPDDGVAAVLRDRLSDREGPRALPFGETVGLVLGLLGIERRRVPSRGRRLATVAVACRALPEWSPFRRSAEFPGSMEAVADALALLREWGIEGDRLHSLAAEAGRSTAAKLADLAQIDDLVRDSMDAAREDYVSDWVRRCLESGERIEGPLPHVVCALGSEERPTAEAWLTWLARAGVDVDLLVEAVPERTDLFAGAWRTVQRLGEKPKVVGDAGWWASLFRGTAPDGGPNVASLTCGDPLAECEWALRQVTDWAVQGWSPDETTVFVRDADTYAPLLWASARRLGVPVSVSERLPLLACGAARAVLALVESLVDPDTRSLAKAARSSYFGVPESEVAWLTDLAVRCSRLGDESWRAMTAALPTAPPWSAAVIGWRAEASQSPTGLSAWLGRLRSLIGASGLPEAVAALDEPRQRQRDERAQTVLQRALADLAFVYDQAGLPGLSLDEFVARSRSAWLAETVTTTPTPGGVRVASADSGLGPCRGLIVLGCLEGTIPRRRREDPVLFDEDLAEVSRLTGLSIPDSTDRARAERDTFIRLCAAASEELVFSHGQTDGDRDTVPSIYLSELGDSLGDRLARVRRPRNRLTPDPSEAVADCDLRLGLALLEPREWPGKPHLESASVRGLLRPDWRLGLGLGEVTDALECPFRAGFRHRLGVAPPTVRAHRASLRRLPERAGLAAKPDRESAERALRELEALLDRLYASADRWEIGLVRAVGERQIGECLDREFGARGLWPRDLASVRLAQAPKGEGVAFVVKVKDHPDVPVRAEAPALWDGPAGPVAQFFSGSRPLQNLRDRGGLAPEDLPFVFWLFALASHFGAPAAIEVDVDGEGRDLLVTDPAARGATREALGLRSRLAFEAQSTVRAQFKERFDSAVRAIEQADLPATPGPHCKGCGYGELCRVSTEFGEADSPFGGGA
jgi:hypothetical protein